MTTKTLTKYHETRYGMWAGSPNGTKADPERCAVTVFPRGQWISIQCKRKCGHGPDGAFCKTHAKRYEGTGK